MIDCRVTIHSCNFQSRPCDNYTCRQAMGKKKYFIGNANGAAHKPIYCEDCITHLVQNIPLELIEGAADLEATLRMQLEQQYAEEYAVRIENEFSKMRAEITEELTLQLVQQQQEAELLRLSNMTTVAGDLVTGENDGKIEESAMAYRCLDCNEEFDSPHKLGGHKRKVHPKVNE